MDYQQLFNSLRDTIHSWFDDKIQVATDLLDQTNVYRNNTLTARNVTEGYRDEAQQAALDATTAVQSAIADLVGQAPETLDTLEEFASALGGDPNFSTTVFQQIGEKADSDDVNAALDGKSDEGHKHLSADVTDAVDHMHGGRAGLLVKVGATGHIRDGNNPSDQYDLANKRYVDEQIATRAASSHTHTVAKVTGLQAALDSKQPKSQTLTQAQYDALGSYDPAVTYNIVDS